MFEAPRPAPSYQPPPVPAAPVSPAPPVSPGRSTKVPLTQRPYFVPLLIGANVLVLAVLGLLLYFLLRK
jgi:hypothetical protein